MVDSIHLEDTDTNCLNFDRVSARNMITSIRFILRSLYVLSRYLLAISIFLSYTTSRLQVVRVVKLRGCLEADTRLPDHSLSILIGALSFSLHPLTETVLKSEDHNTSSTVNLTSGHAMALRK